MVGFRQCQVVWPIGPDQALGLFDGDGKPVPRDDLGHGVDGGRAGTLRLQERVAKLSEQPKLLVDRPSIALKGRGRPPFRASKQPPDQSVKDADGVVGQAHHGVQHRHHQDGAPPRRRQRPQMLRGQPRPLLGELVQTIWMNRDPGCGVETDPAEIFKLVDQPGQGSITWGARRLPRPRHRADGPPRVDFEKGVQSRALGSRQAAGQLLSDPPFGAQHCRGDHSVEDAHARRGDPAPPQLDHQRLNDRHRAHSRQGDRDKPLRQFPMIGLGEASEAEDLAKGVELIVPGRRAGGVVADRLGIDVELLTEEPHHLQRHLFTGADQPAGIAQGAELQCKAKSVVGPATPGDHRQVVRTERVVADQIGLARRQGKQRVELGWGENAASRHGENCPN
jgi:hypothetical protein